MRLTFVAAIAGSLFLLSGALSAQPAPSFQARCGELREAMKGLESREVRELINIEVVGELKIVHETGGIVLLGLCGPPDPRVLCITYETNGRQVGDRVLVVGGIHPAGDARRDEDFIQLDPCLHYLPTDEDKN